MNLDDSQWKRLNGGYRVELASHKDRNPKLPEKLNGAYTSAWLQLAGLPSRTLKQQRTRL